MNETSQEYHKKYPILQLSVAKEIAHGICVSNLAYQVARELGLSEKECHELAIAGLVHDIGKLKLAEYVSHRETLTIEEMKYVRWHARLGAEFLEKQGYDARIVEIVRHHHENCDGSGYPGNLSREEIPFGARVLRVCDVFAALTSNRPYRKSFDVETAMELMIEEAKNYDLQVFLAFMRVAHNQNLRELLEKQGTEEQLSHWTRGLEL